MRLVALTCLAVLAGCAAQTSTPISLPTAINGVERQLQDAGVMSGGNLDSPAKVAAFDASVRTEQCRSRTADPTVSILGTVTLSLNGSFTSGGNFSVTNPLTGLGGNVSREQEQGVSADITFMPLSQITDAYLQREVASLSGLDGKLSASAQRGALTRHDWLADHISSLEASYSDALCNQGRTS